MDQRGSLWEEEVGSGSKERPQSHVFYTAGFLNSVHWAASSPL